MPKIQFICYDNPDNYDYLPISAKDAIPEWFKQTPLINKNIATIKTCPAINDILRCGYIIRAETDIPVIVDLLNKDAHTDKSSPIALPSHPLEQFDKCPHHNRASAFKFTIPFGIKTDPGYSCLYLDPWMHTNQDFTISEGIIDTDTFFSGFNIIAMINRKTDFIIPKGTPIAQIIPYRRETWNFEIIKTDLALASDINKFSKECVDINLNSRKTNPYIHKFHSKKRYA